MPKWRTEGEPRTWSMSENEIIDLRRHGRPPYAVALLHGGPGARGEMAPVARALSSSRGVLEPLQRATSVRGQVEELRRDLEAAGDPPMTLIGFSWGGWLGFILAAEYPDLVGKLILVGCPPFEERYAPAVHLTRMSRLGAEERREASSILRLLVGPGNAGAEESKEALRRLGAILLKADSYDPILSESADVDLQVEAFQAVWREAAELRKSGRLLVLGRRIDCPVVAIHGEYDPHPSDGVRLPLSSVLKSNRFVLLEGCGHKPWVERQARDRFYEILEEELR